MQRLRIIPCLLIHQGGLYKTVRFRQPTYVGDPINAVKIFCEKEADELMLVDIDATVDNRPPDFDFVEDIASQAFMPTGYGGGVKSVADMEKLFSKGVEKVSISAAALAQPSLITECARAFGSQSVVVTIDVKKSLFGRTQIVSHNGRKVWKPELLAWVREVADRGAGEIVLNDVDRDGTQQGYDHDLIRRVVQAVDVPVIALGGARDVTDLKKVIESTGASAAAAGSLFVFCGPRRAVLINYPPPDTWQSRVNESSNP
jgi:cyclase